MKKILSVICISFFIISCNETETKESEPITVIDSPKATIAAKIDSAANKAKIAFDTAAIAAQKAISDAANKANSLKDGAVKRVRGIKLRADKLKKITNKK
jgi:PBP1b-binding outer membrane lipoprotein LpoB